MQQTTAATTKEWVTIKNAAVITGYNPEYIRQLVRAGQIAARKEGVALKIDSESLAYYKSSKSNSIQKQSVVLKSQTQKNGLGTNHKAKGADPRLTSDPYLTDMAIRRHRNNVVIAHLDGLSSVLPLEVKEQKATYQFLRRSLDQDRLSERKRFRTNTTKSKTKKAVRV